MDQIAHSNVTIYLRNLPYKIYANEVPGIGYLQLVFFFYILIGLTYMINGFLMRFYYLKKACLEKISKKFNLKETSTGVLLAIGCSVPEMTTNILSCFDENEEMIDFGFGSIVGSGVFGKYHICAIMYLYSINNTILNNNISIFENKFGLLL
jgi:Ca2+/Na+ antiporter